MNIIPELNLGCHPKDVKNNSLADATNVMVCNNSTVLESECRLGSITDKLIPNEIKNKNIIYALPCNKEILFFNLEENNTITIIRYDEERNQTKKVLEGLPYHNGKLLGTFTYNFRNNLIVSLSEYNATEDVPLKTIDFGTWDDNIVQDLDKLAICPKIILPNVTYNRVNGIFYKGWYNVFIRYKITEYDYTSWYSIGLPFVLSDIKKHNVVKTIITEATNKNGEDLKLGGFIDFFNSSHDRSSDTIEFEFSSLDERYDKYQIAVAIKTNDSSKAYKTEDIEISNNKIILNSNIFISYAIEDLITKTYNYYNVKSLDNIHNRLYIGNYKTKNKIDFNNEISDIELSLTIDHIKYNTTYVDSNYYLNTFTKENRPTLTSISNVEGKISFKEYCRYFSGILSKIGNALDTDVIQFIYLNGVQSSEYSLHSLYIYCNNNDQKGDKVFFEQDGDMQVVYTAGEYLSGLYLNGNNQLTQKSIFTLLKGYSVSSVSYKNIDFNLFKESITNNFDNNTLLSGEVYNFYIHYVDEYGEISNGYKISNKILTKVINDNNNDEVITSLETRDGTININEIVPISFEYGDRANPRQKYKVLAKANGLANSEDSFIYDKTGKLFIFWCSLYDDFFICYESNRTSRVDNSTAINTINSQYLIKEGDIWANIIEPPFDLSGKDIEPELNLNYFMPFINSNNEILFRTPDISSSIVDNNDIPYLNLIKLVINNIKIPVNYIGWFLSYEKMEYRKKLSGFINTASDKYIDEDNTTINIYNDNLNIDNKINLLVDKIKLTSFVIKKYNLVTEQTNNIDSYNRLFSKIRDWSNPWNNINLINAIDVVPSGAIDNYAKSTHLKVKLNNFPTLINELITQNKINGEANSNEFYFVHCELYSSSRDLYINKHKTLVRCSNIYYNEISTPTKLNIFSGFISYDTAIVYNYAGLILSTDNKIRPLSEIVNNTFLEYAIYFFSYPNYSYNLKELKTYNNNSQIQLQPFYVADNENNSVFIETSMVMPANSIDLWKNKYTDVNIEDIYSEYNENYIIDFSNTIRRSNVIQDESNKNAWRIFNTLEYKNINENKGEITKLIGIGKYIIVHTEHSIFLFNATDTIKSNEGGIQLASVDILNLNYQEIITSKLGYAGLQKEHHGIVGTFGYIFYSVEDKTIYRYDADKLITIDDTISNYIRNYNFDDAIFVDDKYRNRLLIKLSNDEMSVILSYNYKTNSFVSLHNYDFIAGYSTKNNIYILSEKDKIKQFNENYFSRSSISVVINTNYELMKYLDVIKYKINKPKSVSSRHNILIPPGDLNNTTEGVVNNLRIYSEYCDTEDIPVINDKLIPNLNIKDDYKTPYWRFGNWHFSTIRNKLMNETIPSDQKSRIFGNWFVVKFDIENDRCATYESLDCKISYDEN